MVKEGLRAQAEMASHELRRSEQALELYVICEIPSNVALAEAFAKIFDGWWIGSNDQTQLTLNVDRDSEIVAQIFDERNEAVKTLIRMAIAAAKRTGRKIGICGQAPSDLSRMCPFSGRARDRESVVESRRGSQNHYPDYRVGTDLGAFGLSQSARVLSSYGVIDMQKSEADK